jgi:hypothetical protein
MRFDRRILVFAGFSVALWLALSTPGPDFARHAWIPLAGWFALGLLTVLPEWTSRRAGTDPETYGMVAVAWGSATSGFGTLLAAAALLVARYSVVPDSRWERWATSPVLGALFVLIFLASFVPLMAMTNRDLGEAGTRPLAERRDGVLSHSDPVKSAEEWRKSGRSER